MTNIFTLNQNTDTDSVEVKDSKGNILYGFITRRKDGSVSSYELVGAKFNEAQFTKEKLWWKRCKSGAVSKAFYEWEEVARQELYKQFFKLNHNMAV